jgi:hypothetical protein
MASDKVEVEGLAQLKKAFRELPKETRKAAAKEMLPVAEKVTAAAAAKTPVGPGSKKAPAGTTRASYGAKATAAGASVSAGKNVPWYKWLDFGGRDPRFGNTRAEGPWRGSGAGPHGGRYLYPALNEHNEQIIEAAGEAIDRAAPAAGWNQ